MSEFRIDDVFQVSFRPNPIMVGRTDDVFAVGDQVELLKDDGSIVRGVLEGIEIHRSPSGQYSFVFSREISEHAEPGDIVRTI
ncbi:hypothetical protein C5E45_23050 [Nocardia nova]|uniref:Uncharacterized protein n=1 Tax=Nocardia nova TaxID=37330 RepID=A0A2S6AL79_9NOCA|nr:hypothetical protein [Nocardia nova]PPJ31741.1 hypothetical protein C5E41_07590 [Nocardia nova]PPJ35980.1 hypothetical protein C5E45_23050 [Nocardia nova]